MDNPAPQQPIAINPSKPKKSPALTVLIVLIMVILLGTLALGIYLVIKDARSSDITVYENGEVKLEGDIDITTSIAPTQVIEEVDCYPNCTADDFNNKIEELLLVNEYTVTGEEGYDCIISTDMIYYHGDIDEDLSFCTETDNITYEARNFIIDGNNYHSEHLRAVEGGDTTLIADLALNESGNPYVDPESHTLISLLPSQDISTEIDSYMGIGQNDVYYQDVISTYDSAQDPKLTDAVYIITRTKGAEICVTDIAEAREGECTIEKRYFDKDLNMVGYETNVEDYFRRYYFANFGETSPIILPSE